MPTSVPPNRDRRRRRAAVTNVGRNSHQNIPKRKPRKNIIPRRVPTYRLFLIWGALLIGCVALAVNLYHLQIINGPKLQAKARQEQTSNLSVLIPRRPIVDRNHSFLAIDRPLYTLYAHPKLFKKSKEAIAVELSILLDRSPAQLVDLFNTRNSGIRVANSISEDLAAKINKHQINGIDLDLKYSRLYPQENLVADVVGYVDVDRHGKAGVEFSQENLLKGSARTIRLQRTAQKELILNKQVPPGFANIDASRLQLTLDSRLQRVSRLALRQQMQKFSAKRGGVIVMDVRDGSILSMVSEPSYDPNRYSNFPPETYKNWLVSDLYEPGSTFKPLNVAIALENRAIQPNDVFPDPDTIKVDGWPIKNAEPEENTSLSVTGILQYSSNVGMVQVMQRLQPQVYYNWLQRLNLTQRVGIDLPSEARGQLRSQKQFVSVAIERATASFGQGGFSLTPIKLVQLQAALANGGKLVTPHVVKGLSDSNGNVYWQPQFPQPRQIFSPQVTQTVLQMMEKVVTDGSGKAAITPGYRIAGKTGTAQKAKLGGGGYQSGANITSFVSIMPADAPRYVILTVVDEPKGIAYGSTVAAPIAKSVIDALISIERILPTQPIPQQQKLEVRN